MAEILHIYHGGDAVLNLDFGSGYNLTGITLFLTAKRSPATADADIEFRIEQSTHTDAVNGKSTITIPKVEVDALQVDAEYACWLQQRTLAGAPSTLGDFVIHVDPAPAVPPP